jgi:hypothetical protein
LANSALDFLHVDVATHEEAGSRCPWKAAQLPKVSISIEAQWRYSKRELGSRKRNNLSPPALPRDHHPNTQETDMKKLASVAVLLLFVSAGALGQIAV